MEAALLNITGRERLQTIIVRSIFFPAVVGFLIFLATVISNPKSITAPGVMGAVRADLVLVVIFWIPFLLFFLIFWLIRRPKPHG